jgi:ABC-type lipoprotein release transport system permease subunit
MTDSAIAVSPGLAVRPRPRVSWVLRLPYPLRNVVRRWTSLLGMIVGVGIALGMGMTMLAVATASVELYVGDWRISRANLYVVQQGGTLIPILPSDVPGSIPHASSVMAQVRALPAVRAALGVVTWSFERETEDRRNRDEPSELVTSMGVDGDPTLIPGALALQSGRWLRRPDEVVVGARLARGKQLGLGDSLRLNGRTFTVVGVGKLRGFGFGADTFAYLDIQAFRQRAGIGDVFNIMAIQATDEAGVRQRVSEIASVATFNREQLIVLAQQAQASSVVIFWTLIVLTMTIAALFVSTVLSRSVAERRLEFATLRAIGVSTHTVLLTVGAEAALVSVLATLVGAALSLALGWPLNALAAPANNVDVLYVVDAGLFEAVFALALGLGVISGILPARQATRVDPVVVLREA